MIFLNGIDQRNEEFGMGNANWKTDPKQTCRMDIFKTRGKKKKAGLIRKPALIQYEGRSPEAHDGSPPKEREQSLSFANSYSPKSALHSMECRAALNPAWFRAHSAFVLQS
jgi:hypothetical protein